MSFEPFRSVVIPKGKMGAGFDPNAPPDPAQARETRTIILEGPALDPGAISGAPVAPARRTTVTRPGSVAGEGSRTEGSPAASPAVSHRAATAAAEGGEVWVVADAPAAAPRAAAGSTRRESAEGGGRRGSGATPAAQRQYVVAYDGCLVGTYRCAKRIQNRTAYLKVAEQLVGQIDDLDPGRIRLYRLTEVPIAEPVRREELGESFHNFPRDDVPAPDA